MKKEITLKFLEGIEVEAVDGGVILKFDTDVTKRDLWLNQIEFWSETNDKIKESGYIRLENNDKLKLIKNR